jgi:AraC-like DNA-binding protein
MIKKKEGFQGQKAIVLPRKIINDLCVKSQIMKGIHITDIGYYPKAKHHFRERLHGSDQNILIYCVEGKGSATVNKKKYQLTPDSFLIIPANTAHRYAADENDSWTIYWLHFKGDNAKPIVDAMLSQINGHHGLVNFQQNRISLFQDIYYSLERGYGNDNLCYASMCLWHYLSSFIYNDKFNISENKQSIVKDAVELSINYMQENLSRMLLLNNIAGSVNLSIPHFSAIFRKKTGFSPIEYFIHLKAQKACQYLLFTDLRIKEIAEKLGIDDPYYFSRMFHKLMGISPNQYRKKRNT